MSLYYEAAEILKAPTNAGGSLKSRVFSKKNLKSQPAQIYALVIETCKWSSVLKEVIERANLLVLERKVTPLLSLLLVHDFLLAKTGIALPVTHGLRVAIERHKARLHAEFTKARIRRSLGSVDALRKYIESGAGEASKVGSLSHPRWIRINTLKTQLEDQLDTTFAGYEIVRTVNEVRQRGSLRLWIDDHVPNLVAVPASVDLTKSEAYKSGAIIFQDKASCFPAYLLDPLPEDGDIIDTCAAPGNKTTHLAAILSSHNGHDQTIYAMEKDKSRAETLQKMIKQAGSGAFTKVNAGQDCLKIDPNSPEYKNVGALLLDPSCSGSGIVGRDDMPELHIPEISKAAASSSKSRGKPQANEKKEDNLKRKRSPVPEDVVEVMVDDDGLPSPINTLQDLQTRLAALSAFQLSLLVHAFSFPQARKITYSTCSTHAEENESVVLKALASPIAKQRGWRIQRRTEQIRGMREWPVRGDCSACGDDEDLAEACIRANKDDEYGTMGFFLVGFVRESDEEGAVAVLAKSVVRDEDGFIVRDSLGVPVTTASEGSSEDRVDAIREGDDDDNGEAAALAESVVRDERGFIVRDSLGFPLFAASTNRPDVVEGKDGSGRDDEEEWEGFDDVDEGIPWNENSGGQEPTRVTAKATNSTKPAKRKRKGSKPK